MVEVEYFREQVRQFVQSKRWIVAMDAAVPATAMALQLLELGAERVLAIGTSRGTGELGEHERLNTLVLNARSSGMMETIRHAESLLSALPPEAQREVDAFDPERTAMVVRALFSTGEPVGGRATFGARPPDWLALEDKTRIDSFWDAAGIRRAASQVIALNDDNLLSVSRQLDAGAGCVWAADNRDGWHGGGQFLRIVQTAEHAERAKRFLATAADRVRIMPMLEGTPCSIHGIVWNGAVVALRPCEMVVFRVPAEQRFAYGAASTFWLPSDDAARQMREVALKAGRHLFSEVGFRGCFTVDGVLTTNGFLPTELNPRYGAALANLRAGVEGLPLYYLHLAMVEGLDLDYRINELEELIVTTSLSNPRGRSFQLIPHQVTPRDAYLRCDSNGSHFDPEQYHFHVQLGPAASGAVLMLHANPKTIEMGPTLAPRVAQAFAFLKREWKLPIPDLQSAPSLP